MRIRVLGLTALVAIAAVACGGGSSSPSTGDQPPATSGPDDPTFVIRSTGVLSEGVLSAELALAETARLLDLARFSVDLAHRFTDAHGASVLTTRCAYGGNITLVLDDRDGDSRASAGDAITAVLDRCGVPRLNRAGTGTLRVEIIAAAPRVETALQARLSFTTPLLLTEMAGGPFRPVQAVEQRGSMLVHWAESADQMQTRVLSTSEDDLRVVPGPSSIAPRVSMSRVDLAQTLRFDVARIETRFDYRLRQDAGWLRVRTTSPIRGELDAAPREWDIEAVGAAGWKYRWQRGEREGSWPSVLIDVVQPSGATADSTILRPLWHLLPALGKDPRHEGAYLAYSDRSGGYFVVVPWKALSGNSIGDEPFRVEGGGVVSPLKIDALFQRPVAAHKALTESGTEVQLQFRAAMGDSYPQLQFRWIDVGYVEGVEVGTPRSTIATAVERQGSLFRIRAAEPLRRGRNYSLQVSLGGVGWGTELELRDVSGDPFLSRFSNVTLVSMDSSIVVSPFGSDLALASTSSASSLRTEVSVTGDRAVAGYRWEQISGPALNIVSPNSPHTEVTPGWAGLLGLTEAVMQVTVTSNLGESDYARVVLQVGDIQSEGAWFYTETKRSLHPLRQVRIGPGSFFYGPEPGAIGVRLPPADDGTTGVEFSVTPANGARLAVGQYSDAILSQDPGGSNGLVSRVTCLDRLSEVVGSFEVIEVEYNSVGQITRLAIDFQQSCLGGQGEYQRGSFRFNSAIPITP